MSHLILMFFLISLNFACKQEEQSQPTPAKRDRSPASTTKNKPKKTTSPAETREESSGEDELDWDRITYTLEEDPSADAATKAKYQEIDKALGEAIELYLRHTSLRVHLNVKYDPGVPTAQAKPSDTEPGEGTIDFGGMISKRVALHELGHVFGAGFWGDLSKDGEFHGPLAKAKLAEIDGKGAKLNADKQHFWPYGMNQDSDVKSDQDFVSHCLMTEAIHQDIENSKKENGFNLKAVRYTPIP